MEDLMEPAPTPAARPRARRRPVFHPLRVATVQPLCEDAAAVSFDIPAELAEEFTFAPGQSLTLRRAIDGRDERRSYSICAPPARHRASACGWCRAASSPPGWCTTYAPVTPSR